MCPRSSCRSGGTCERTLTCSGFRSGGTSEWTLVPALVLGEHPPKPPFLENHPFVNPRSELHKHHITKFVFECCTALSRKTSMGDTGGTALGLCSEEVAREEHQRFVQPKGPNQGPF